MEKISMIGLDTAKSIFQVHGTDEKGECILVRQLKRRDVLAFFRKLPFCTVALEACGASHYWAREIGALGHQVRLVPPRFVKLFVEGRRKSDARDARALAFAGKSADLRAVPVKSAERQAELLVIKARSLLVRQHTQAGNALRGHLAEFGLTARAGAKGLEDLISRVESGGAQVPDAAIAALAALTGQWRRLEAGIAQLTAQLIAQARGSQTVKRLMSVPGVGPVTASVFALKVDDPARFACGRSCAAWLGLVPNLRASAGKSRLGAISKAGDEDLRSLLVMGAASLLIRAKAAPQKADPWVRDIARRKPFKVAAVALAARIARTLWALVRHGGTYKPRQNASACQDMAAMAAMAA
jgi:transposase